MGFFYACSSITSAGRKSFNMVILKPTQNNSNALINWLKESGNERDWLCEKLKITPGYLSQIMNGGTNEHGGISSEMISALLTLLNYKFERLFMIVPDRDDPNHQRHNYKKFKERD